MVACPAAALRRFRTLHNLRGVGPCDPTTVQRLIDKFRRTGSVADEPKGHPNISPDVVAEVSMQIDEISGQTAHGSCSKRARV